MVRVRKHLRNLAREIRAPASPANALSDLTSFLKTLPDKHVTLVVNGKDAITFPSPSDAVHWVYENRGFLAGTLIGVILIAGAIPGYTDALLNGSIHTPTYLSPRSVAELSQVALPLLGGAMGGVAGIKLQHDLKEVDITHFRIPKVEIR